MKKLTAPAGLAFVALALLGGCDCAKTPRTPDKPNGPRSVPKGAIATYSAVTTDPNDLPIAYQFDWGDAAQSDWGAFGSGDSVVSDTHIFAQNGQYGVKVRAKNTKGAASSWSDTLLVSVVVGESAKKWVYVARDPEDPEYWLPFQYSVAMNKDGSQVFAVCTDAPPSLHVLSSGGGPIRKFSTFNEDDFVNNPSASDDGRFYICSSEPILYCLQGTGSMVWSWPLTAEIEGSVATDAQGNLYFNCNDGRLHAYNRAGGDRWTPVYTGGGPASPVITSDGSLVIVGGYDSTIHAIKTEDGQPDWTLRTNGSVDCSPAIGADGSIYIGSDDGILRKLNQKGEIGWQYPAQSPIKASPVIDADGRIYFTSEDGVLHMVDPTSGTGQTLALGCIDPSTGALSAAGLFYFTASFPGGSDSVVAINVPALERRWGVEMLDGVTSPQNSPLIDMTGAVIMTADTGVVALWGQGLPAASAWPMFQRDQMRSGRAR